MDTNEQASEDYAQSVGERLRAIRHQKGFALQEVEASTASEFKASVLGAYERGERAISVPRLQRLAGFYGVPVDQLLPEAEGTGPTTGGDVVITFDLSRLGEVEDPELTMIRHYLERIQILRQDFNGRVLTIRRDDIGAMAGMFGVDPGELVDRLDRLRIRFSRGD